VFVKFAALSGSFVNVDSEERYHNRTVTVPISSTRER
jgi:hypothetical protein